MTSKGRHRSWRSKRREAPGVVFIAEHAEHPAKPTEKVWELQSVEGLAPQINCFIHTPHPIFFSSSIFYPYSFSSFFYIPFCPSHPFFIIIFQFFCNPFLLSPRLIHFTNYPPKCHFLNLLTSSISKKEILQNILQKIFVKKIFELSKNDLSISRTKNRTATTSLPPSFHQFYHIFVWGVARLVGFYLQYIKRYTYIIIITYKGINVIIIV